MGGDTLPAPCTKRAAVSKSLLAPAPGKGMQTYHREGLISTDDDGQCLSCGEGRYCGAKDDIAGSVTIGAAACEADPGLRRA